MSLARNTTIYTIGNLLPALAGFLLLPLYSNYMTPEEYAIIASMEVLAYIYGVLVNFNLERASYRFYFDKDDVQWRKDLFFTLHSSSIALAVVWLLIVLLLQDIISMIFPSIPFWPIYILVFGRATVEVLLSVPQQYFQVTEKPLHFVGINLLRFFLNVSLVLWFLIVLEEGAEGILTASLIASSLLVPISIYIALKYFRGSFRVEILKDALNFCWPFIPTLIVAWIINLSDRVFLEYYAESSQLGIYGMAYKISSVYLLMMGAYHTAYLPRFYKLANDIDQVSAKLQLKKDAIVNITVHIVLLFMLLLWAHELVLWLLDEKYEDVTDILRLIFISHLFAAIPVVTYSAALLQSKKTKLNMYAAILAAIINVILNTILIPVYGMYGAAIATVISMVSLFIIQYLAAKQAYFIELPWKILWLGLISSLTLVFLFYYYIEDQELVSFVLKSLLTLLICAYIIRKILKEQFGIRFIDLINGKNND